MILYILPSQIRLAPFGDAPPVLPILDIPLAVIQDETARSVSLTVRRVKSLSGNEPKPYLVTYDNLFFSEGLLRRFMDASALVDGNCAAGLPKGPLADFVRPPLIPGVNRMMVSEEGAAFALCHIKDRPFSPEEWQEYTFIDAGDRVMPFDTTLMKYLRGAELWSVPVSENIIIPIEHWVHLLAANWLALGMRLFPALGDLRRQDYRSLKKRIKIEKGSDIHPTAVLEGVVLGKNVTVGPNCYLKACYIANGAHLERDVRAEWSILGEKSFVTKGCNLLGCLAYPEAVLASQLIGHSIFGRGAVSTTGVWVLDLFEEQVLVSHGDLELESGHRFLGACFGHDVRLGTTTYFRAGIAVPNGYNIVMNPDRIAFKIADDLPRDKPLRVVDRVVVPMEK